MNWQKISRLVLLASIGVNIGCYFFGGYVLGLFMLNQSGVLNDFYGAFMPAVHRFLENPVTLYEFTTAPLRNIPEIIYYYMIFYSITPQYNLNLLACSSVILFFNLVCCHVIMKITSLKRFQDTSLPASFNLVPILLAAYLLTPMQPFEYVNGQVNVITNTFLLLGIYYLYKKNEKLAFFFLGCSAAFKITILLLIPFFLFVDIRSNPVKKMVYRAFFLIVPLIPSIILFLTIPGLLTTFLELNIVATGLYNQTFTSGNCSLTKFLATVFNLNIIMMFIVIAVLIYGISACVLLKYHVTLIERTMLGMFSMILIMPDFYGLHFFFILGVAILWFLTRPGIHGVIYRFTFLVITVSFLGWYYDPLSSLVVVFFYTLHVSEIVLGSRIQQARPVSFSPASLTD